MRGAFARLLARLLRRRAELARVRGQRAGGHQAGEHGSQAGPSALTLDPGGPDRRSRSRASSHTVASSQQDGGAPLVGIPRALAGRLAARAHRSAQLGRRDVELAGGVAFDALRAAAAQACRLAGEQRQGVRQRAAAQAGLTVGDWPGAFDLDGNGDLGGGVAHAR